MSNDGQGIPPNCMSMVVVPGFDHQQIQIFSQGPRVASQCLDESSLRVRAIPPKEVRTSYLTILSLPIREFPPGRRRHITVFPVGKRFALIPQQWLEVSRSKPHLTQIGHSLRI